VAPVPFPFLDSGGGNVYTQTYTYRDAKGFTATVKYHIAENGGDADAVDTLANNINTAFAALTNAKPQAASGAFSFLGVKQYGTAAAYGSVRMKARLVFQDAAGALHSFYVPAAKIAIFDADMQTVLPSAVSTLVGLMTNVSAFPPASGTVYVCSQDGIQYTNFMGGFFVARQTKKNKTFYLDAQLTPSEPGD
jgi:hypothetical protein